MLEPGLKGELRHLVRFEDTAAAFGLTGVEVLGTPILAGLLEDAAREAIEAELTADQLTVGASLNFKHLAMTPVGFTVTVRAELIEVDRARLVFAVSADDGVDKIAEGTHERFVLPQEKFLKNLAAKKAR